ncbi:MAG: tetratricopeptide repeat protein [Treponema sp.]|nr:tetratricopeptide repeat protein [Treponema sp.]
MSKKKCKAAGCYHIYLLALLLFAVLPVAAHSLDLLFRPKAFVFLPMGEGNFNIHGNPRYEMGGGADIGFEFDLSSILPNPLGIGYTIGIEGGITTNPMLGNDPKSFMIYSAGGTLGLYFYPFSRLFMRIDGSVGVYVGVLEKYLTPAGLYWRGGGEIGFRFSPAFLLALNSGWRQYEDPRPGVQPANSGFYGGLTAQITLSVGSSSNRRGAEAVLVQPTPIYPAFLQLYQTIPVGTVKIRNRENAEIRNVRLSFRAAGYTSSEFFCGSALIVPRGREIELPLLADFSPAVLRFTDNSRILGELIVRYTFLGQQRETITVVTVASYSRNTVTDYDTESLAALISPTSPEILEFSKYVIGLARSSRRTGHNQNMQYAIWLYEGLRALGIRIGETHNLENEAQFPAETLIFGRGSSRDVALLFAASLESVGISSAFIKVGTDYIVAIDLNMTQAAAETMFSNSDRVLVIDNNCWLPVAMSSFDDGFMPSWMRGVVTLNHAFNQGDNVEFIITSDAWAVYPPAPIPELGTRAGRSNSEVILAEANQVIDQYIAQDIMPIIWMVEAQISRGPSAALYNRLGILLARAGRMNDAKVNYERAANMGLVAAMSNRGSLALTERDYNTAEFWFRRVLAADSRNVTALRGMERVEGRR